MFAIIFDEENCIFARRNACILRTYKVVVKLLQNSAVIHFFIQSPVIFLTEIVIFAAKSIEEFRFNMNFIVALKNFFRRLIHLACLELVELLFHAVSDKFFVIRRFLGNKLVNRLIARLFQFFFEIRYNLFFGKIVIPLIIRIGIVALVKIRIFKRRFQIAYNVVKTSFVLAVDHIKPIYFVELLVYKLVKVYFIHNVYGIIFQFHVRNISRQRRINTVVIPPVRRKQNIQRETLMIPFKKRLYKRFRFFARRILSVKHTVYRYPFFIKSVRNRIRVHSVKVTHFFVHNFARTFDNVVPSGQIRFTTFGRNKRFPSGLFNTV